MLSTRSDRALPSPDSRAGIAPVAMRRALRAVLNPKPGIAHLAKAILIIPTNAVRSRPFLREPRNTRCDMMAPMLGTGAETWRFQGNHSTDKRTCRTFRRIYAMLGWAVTFLVVALVAALLGFGGIAGTAMEAAKLVFFVAIVLFAISAVVGLMRGRSPTL